MTSVIERDGRFAADVQDRRAPSCPRCGDSNAEPLAGQPATQLQSCPRCGHCFAWPLPAALTGAHCDQYWTPELLRERGLPSIAEREAEHATLAAQRVARDLAPFWRGLPMLDVGAGAGALIECARRHSMAMDGIDLSRRACVYARATRGVEIAHADANATDARSSAYDIVTLYNVLDLQPDPARTLAECKRILRAGGLLVLETLSRDSLWCSSLQAWRALEGLDVLHVFDEAGLVELLNAAHFFVVDQYCSDEDHQVVLAEAL